MNNQVGLTLVEMLVALTLASIVMVIVQSLYTSQTRSYKVEEEVSEAQQDIRISLDIMARDLREAGFGLPTGGGFTPVGSATDPDDKDFPLDPNPDSITVSKAINDTTFMTDVPAGAVIPVVQAEGFIVGNIVNMLHPNNRIKANPGEFVITAIDKVSDPNTITLDQIPVDAEMGDVVVGEAVTFTYCLEADPDFPGTFILERITGVGGACGLAVLPVGVTVEELANRIVDLQFKYIMDTGAELNTVPAASLGNVRLVQIILVAQTTSDMTKTAGGNQRTRTLKTIVQMKNMESI